MIALAWVPCGVLLLSLLPAYVRSIGYGSWYEVIIVAGAAVGVVSLIRRRGSNTARLIAVAAYIIVMPFLLFLAVYAVGFATDIVTMGHI